MAQLAEDREKGQAGAFPAPKRVGPKKIIPQCPEVPDHLLLYWDAFIEVLASCPGGSITTRAVLDYCEAFEIRDRDTREDILRICRLLSTEYLGILKKNHQRSKTLKDKMAGRSAPSRPKIPSRNKR